MAEDIMNIVSSEYGEAEAGTKLMEDKPTADPFMEAGMYVPSPIISDIKAKMDLAYRARRFREDQWLKNVNSYRGDDSSDNVMRDSERSKVYVRTTTVKVKAAYAQTVEALFSDNKFPISITDTRVPEGVSEWAHLKTDMEPNVPVESAEEPQEPEAPIGGVGFAGDGFDIQPGSTQNNMHFLGGLREEFTDEGGDTVLAEGPDRTGGGVQISPSKMLARQMEKVIHDQLEESQARTEMRRMIFEMCLLGTGIMKGPFNVNKTIPQWSTGDNGESIYEPITRKAAHISMVSVWNFYPDPNALTPEDLEWVVERHRMNKQQVSELKRRPHFFHKPIDRLIAGPGNYERESYEHVLDEKDVRESEDQLYDVLEFWGYMSKDMLKEYDLDLSDFEGDRAQVNVWVSGNEVLRVVVNPFLPQRIPYYIVPYEADAWTIWGTGVPESMEDSQALMNGFMRLAVDNLALAGNMVFDIDDSMLVPGQPMEIQPGQIFRRQAGGVGQAINGIQFPNTAPANLDMYRTVRQIADEETGIPSFAHGQMGVMSPTRTASGMSMLLQNASLNIKTVIRNIDDYLLKPMGQAYYRWNMQFNERVDIKGDLEVKAMGSAAMQAKEVRANRLNTFLQLASNPAIAPLIKIPTIVKELAIAMEMDPTEILNSPEEAQIYARLMGDQNMQHAQPGMPGQSTDQVPMPGEGGFSGNAAGAGNELGINGPEGMMNGSAAPAV